jgi:hypothetical protein
VHCPSGLNGWIQHLGLAEVAENLYTTQHAEKFLKLVLTKPRLTSLQFPHVVNITHHSVLIYEPCANFVTDTYDNNDGFVVEAERRRTAPQRHPATAGTSCCPTTKTNSPAGGNFNPRVLPSNKPLIPPLGVHLYISNWRAKIYRLDSDPAQTIAVH